MDQSKGTVACELRQVSMHYPDGDETRAALDAVSLRVAVGEFVAVMGPSGSGKSTLVHVLAGVEPATAGEVAIRGEVLGPQDRRAWIRARRKDIGVVYQRLNLLPTLSALENVALPLELDGFNRRAAASMAAAALADVGLASLAHRRPDHLSGGQQQRVAVARALVGERSLLLADEPSGALDSAAAEDVVRLLADRARAGGAVLMVTHDSRMASWADRIVELRDGRLTGVAA